MLMRHSTKLMRKNQDKPKGGVSIPPSPPYLFKPIYIVLFPSVLHTATFFVAIVEPCSEETDGNSNCLLP
jgi:hypothetical protein